jgi:hypothetical protein
MQTAVALAFVPRSAKAPVAPQLAEFRFQSDAALERALDLASGQSWIAACAVDRARRTLRVTLAAGTSQPPGLGRHSERASSLH